MEKSIVFLMPLGIDLRTKFLISPLKTTSCTKVAQNGAKLVPNWDQKTTKNGVPHRTWEPKMGYPIGLGGQKRGYPIGPWGQHLEKNRLKKATQQKTQDRIFLPPHLLRKNGQHGSKLGSKINQKSIQNPCKNPCKNRCLLGLIYNRNLVEFWCQNEAKLTPKWHQKSMLT